MDCYNLIVLKDICCTIKATWDRSNDKFLMDVFDEDQDKGGD